MDIIRRNFFRLLRAGVFGNEEQIEPMSAWKWRQLYELAERLKLTTMAFDGVQQCKGQFFMQLPDDLLRRGNEEDEKATQRWQQAVGELAELMDILSRMQWRPVLLEPWTTAMLCAMPHHHSIGRVCVYFPYETQGRKADEWAIANATDYDDTHRHLLRYQWKSLKVEHRHRLLLLNSRLNNSTLQNIVEQERLEGGTSHVVIEGQRMETVSPTLAMLVALLGIVRTSLDEGLRLWQIVDLGVLLRRQGDRVDFVKLQGWIERLSFTRMAQLVATVLTGLLGFTADEVPFVHPSKIGGDVDGIADNLLHSKSRSNARYLRYNPGEGFASMLAAITHRLGNVKE